MRQFLRNSRAATNEVMALLQSIFAAELLHPSRSIWLVSPWLSDIEVLDNRTGTFRALNPDWENRPVHLSEVFGELAGRGTRINLVTRKAGSHFVETVRAKLPANLVDERIHVLFTEALHTKGLVTETCSLSGSMNFTFNGLFQLDEMLTYQTSPDEVAHLRLAFTQEYGGAM